MGFILEKALKHLEKYGNSKIKWCQIHVLTDHVGADLHKKKYIQYIYIMQHGSMENVNTLQVPVICSQVEPITT